MEGRARIAIEMVHPQIDCGRFAVQRIAGDEMVVQADVFSDGHDEVVALLLYRRMGEEQWQESVMRRLNNDRWEGSFVLGEPGFYQYTLMGWVDHFRTWQRDLQKRFEAGQDVAVDLRIGAKILEQAAGEANAEDAARLREAAAALSAEKDQEGAVALGLETRLADLVSTCCARGLATLYHKELVVRVDRKKALFSSWYELFPRSLGVEGRHGTLRDCIALLPDIAMLGFDVLYLPPIHPIGSSKRKGKANAVEAQPGDPGSPWAIGSEAGGHKTVHPELGTLDDFRYLVREAERHGIEIALDLAFQCSPDHPYLKEHPEWFTWRPDGTVQYAENPPKKYQDIVPINFETAQWEELWEELKSIVFFWMDQGVRIFRVDNPHTKPFPMWEWLIGQAKEKSQDVIFLAEAFTRPKIMARLAKLGFTQSYSYFSWRNSKGELTEYLTELTRGDTREFMRPNFWPNTPDILTEYLQYGGRPAFMIRLVLAATLSSNYGIYGPAYELCVGEPEKPGSEEYRDAEKYEIRQWDREGGGNIRELIVMLNRVRRDHAALQQTNNVTFLAADDDSVLFYAKIAEQKKGSLLVAVNLDPFRVRTARLSLPLELFGVRPGQSYLLHDLIGGDHSIWQGETATVRLDPQINPACIYRISTWQRRESDFDYYF
ncbi:alpha-1,4-glucan--maltose-1-phosphate maltosyltransferase [Geomonas sp. Red69]|uniref:Alpha-1,4-glucan:maltose-1-phosphate maltosyltransferase n=1 Tax=Geomonas diazotrophica TaxID=2843197 RepID=A0ABX8JGI8_9BACT|nr:MULTISPECIES: alpha-1,4-glucan--maltose-1-phosphate maltosyltransferase [Geomonas]MBU5635443.1 alpha-1,4-glucan--maltose-1-phosphate maltosyltransferase [Geomonas diazotrophica]QWV97504.1 alpha-1,4-glucan--maltose-1-phosphate maltosyltransferase [Geomonas nitrogeniifigens]QXE86644.1 alpha-1,4-glucan--maltose-1-phosphate maltosyltransferase [Geomonas nitrogeniifigens]